MADRYGRTGGPFLDQVEAEAREVKSAEIEGREPDFSVENLFPLDTPLVSEVIEEINSAVVTPVDVTPAQAAPPASQADAEAPTVVEAPSVPVETELEVNSNEVKLNDDPFAE